jgi:hypothetical protein
MCRRLARHDVQARRLRRSLLRSRIHELSVSSFSGAFLNPFRFISPCSIGIVGRFGAVELGEAEAL